jgi:hypothetical protein
MTQMRLLTFVVLCLTFAFGSRHAIAQSSKHKQEEAARHAAERAAHERHKQEEAARHAAHERKLHEEAAKHAAEKAEHEKKMQQHAEHEKKMKAESEARIAAARKHRSSNPVQKHKQTAQDRQIAATLSNVAVHLHRADHDYDWQRHEAVELVRGALHELHEHEPDTNGKFGGMTQKQSDQILRENIPVLQSARSQLSAKGAPPHHQAAVVKIDEALSNLHAALKIR